MNTGALIKEYRVENGLTQSELAHQLAVNAMTVSRWERGATQPSDLTRVRIARVLGVHPNALLSKDAAA